MVDPTQNALLERVRLLFWSIGTHDAPITSDDFWKSAYTKVDPDHLRDLLYDVYVSLGGEIRSEAMRERKLIPGPSKDSPASPTLDRNALDSNE